MSCERHHELMSVELDGELRPEEEPALWSHLASCAECRSWRADQLAIRHDFQRWPEESLPDSVYPEVVDARPANRGYRIPRVLAWAAGLIIVVQGAYLGGLLSTGSDTGLRTVSPNGEDIETIELTIDDRVSQRIEQMLAVPGSGIDRTENGG